MPGTLQEGGAAFASTHWTVVLLAAQSQTPEAAQAALASFCQSYWPPLYSFLRRRGHPSADAQDLVQAFFAHVFEYKTLARASQEKGRLRTFLLASLQNFLANEHDRAQALKRGGGRQIVSMDERLFAAEAAVVAAGDLDETGRFDKHWAAALLSQTWERLHGEMAREGRGPLMDELRPFVVGGPAIAPPSQEEAAARLGMPISTFRNHLLRLRRRFREALREEVGRTVADDAQIDEEMQYLFRVLLS